MYNIPIVTSNFARGHRHKVNAHCWMLNAHLKRTFEIEGSMRGKDIYTTTNR